MACTVAGQLFFFVLRLFSVFPRSHPTTVAHQPAVKYTNVNAEQVYPHGDVFPLVPCEFAGNTRWCPRDSKAVLLALYDSLEVPFNQLRAQDPKDLSPWYTEKLHSFEERDTALRSQIQRCCNVADDFVVPIFGVGNMGTNKTTFELRISVRSE